MPQRCTCIELIDRKPHPADNVVYEQDISKMLPSIAALVDASAQRDPNLEVRKLVVEVVHLLVVNRAERTYLRNIQIYALLRELHKVPFLSLAHQKRGCHWCALFIGPTRVFVYKRHVLRVKVVVATTACANGCLIVGIAYPILMRVPTGRNG
jgi:hypothetical protein